jgi:hypothetical protein
MPHYLAVDDRRRRPAFVSALFALPLAFAVLPSQARADEIVVNITRVKALDKFDELSKADMLARVTIAGEAFTTAVTKDQDDIRPNWVIRKNVPPGVHDVKVEILDKDVTKNELVDINRLNNRRDINFQVNTQNCQVTGFAQSYRCGSAIVRAGNERKKAAITFKVDVKR